MRSSANSISRHILVTYSCLRLGIAVLAFVLPILLFLVGLSHGLGLQDSFSAYYHAFSDVPEIAHSVAGQGVARDWFVGILWAIGACLVFYHGYDQREDIVLNFSGILLVVVAMVPTGWLCADSCPISIHSVAAILFFVGISYVAIFRSRDTLDLIQNKKVKGRLSTFYVVLGVLMILLPLLALWLNQFNMNIFGTNLIYWLEFVAVYVFSIYWLTKTIELKMTNADQAVLDGTLSRSTQGRGALGYWFDLSPSNLRELARPN
jgi:hypothetical protein